MENGGLAGWIRVVVVTHEMMREGSFIVEKPMISPNPYAVLASLIAFIKWNIWCACTFGAKMDCHVWSGTFEDATCFHR
jgi:hypothetical protein